MLAHVGGVFLFFVVFGHFLIIYFAISGSKAERLIFCVMQFLLSF